MRLFSRLLKSREYAVGLISLNAGLCLLAILISGCSGTVIQSPVFEGINLRALISAPSGIRSPSSTETVVQKPEYLFKDCQVGLPIEKDLRDSYVDKVVGSFKSEVKRLGGNVLDNNANNGAGRFEVEYSTQNTSGRFVLYVSEQEGTELKMIGVLIECAKR